MAEVHNLLGVYLDSTTTAAKHKLGTLCQGADGATFMYVRYTSATTQYRWVGIDENFAALNVTKGIIDDGWFIGVAQATAAAADYGWAQMAGKTSAFIEGLATADTALYSTGTEGMLGIDASAQTKVDGVVAVSTVATANANTTCILTWPRSATF